MTVFSGTAKWIWVSDTQGQDGASVGACAVFSRVFAAPALARLRVHVSADSAYRLWVNGVLAASGPVRGEPEHWFYDSVDVSGLLVTGNNELRAEVVCFVVAWPDYRRGGPSVSMMSMAPGFILEGVLCGPDGGVIEVLSSDCRWRGVLSRCARFVRCPGVPCAGPGEEADAALPWPVPVNAPAAMEVAEGVTAATVTDSLMPHRLVPREIPMLPEIPQHFVSGDSPCDLDAHTTQEFLLDAGAITTGYPLIELEGEGVVSLFYAERLLREGVPVMCRFRPGRRIG